jgi:stage V sporulation protein G
MIQSRVIAEYQSELERAKEPGYASRYDDDYGEDDFDANLLPESRPRSATKQIEPAQSTPPPPHRTPIQPMTAPTAIHRREGFGAGIFDG